MRFRFNVAPGAEQAEREARIQHHAVEIEPAALCRRNLQRAYLEHIKNELNPKDAPATTILRPMLPDDDGLFSASNRGTDFRAVARAALRTLAGQLDAAIPRAQDVMTRVHLQDCRREVELILNPKN